MPTKNKKPVKKKPVKKTSSRTVKSSVPTAKLARKAPVAKKFVAAQPPKHQPFSTSQPDKKAVRSETTSAVKKSVAIQPSEYQPFTAPEPVKKAVMSETWKAPVIETPPPAPVVHAPVPVNTPTQAASGEELYNRIQYHAYLLAEKDGFRADPVHYWVQAERAVKAEIRHPTGT